MRYDLTLHFCQLPALKSISPKPAPKLIVTTNAERDNIAVTATECESIQNFEMRP